MSWLLPQIREHTPLESIDYTNDVEGEQNKVKPAFKDDGRLKKFEGLEDIKILGVY